MAIQSVSGANSTANLFPSSQAAAARSALAALVSARVDLSKRPIQTQNFASLNGLSVQRASIEAESNSLAGSKATFDSVSSVLEASKSILTDLADVITAAQVAAPGDLAGLQASADALIDGLRNRLGGFNGNFPSARIITAAPGAVNLDNSVVKSIDIYSIEGSIPAAGFNITVDAKPSASLTSEGTGRRAQTNIIFPVGDDVLDGTVQFTIDGPLGQAAFTFGPGTTRDQIIAAVNDERSATGIEAQASGNNVRAFTLDFGSQQFIQVNELLDTNGEFLAQPTAYGFDAVADITINGQTAEVTGVGRVLEFDIAGVRGKIKLHDFVSGGTGLNEQLNAAAVNVKVVNGGLSVPSLGERLIGFPSLNFSSLGQTRGGLNSIDLVNDSVTAQQIVNEAISDIGQGLAVSDSFSNILGNNIASNTTRLADLDSTIADTQALLQGLTLFDTIAAEANFQAANAIFSQTISLFPLSASRLL